ncbi:MAG: hypothetical protein C3F12_14165 [Candidatus Methylomirabilota bacterium]|nr:hypothetical protein [Candidatus Methylomirabilis sp.]NJD68210.1 hypothetical protein [candidate division NC10 bacterium]PWB42350.1 MAG: hypothetical protein C3F12_14165 [candidate division NC10 bacterium]
MAARVPVLIAVVLTLAFAAGCRKGDTHLATVTVGSPAVYCLFDPSCKVTTIESSTAPIPMQVEGTAFIESRTFAGKPGTPAAGLYGYEYRINLEQAVATTHMPCLRTMALEFGPIVDTLDYNGDGQAGDLIYVVTDGGPGKIGIDHVHGWTNRFIVYFDSPVCAGPSGVRGDSTYAFGLVSAQPPRAVTATLKETADLTATSSKLKDSPAYDVLVRAPQASTAH